MLGGGQLRSAILEVKHRPPIALRSIPCKLFYQFVVLTALAIATKEPKFGPSPTAIFIDLSKLLTLLMSCVNYMSGRTLCVALVNCAKSSKE